MNLSNEALSILVSLAPGYLGFRLYLIDSDWSSVRTPDILYGSLFFAILQRSTWVPDTFVFLFITSTLASLSAAVLWKKFGHPKFHALMYKLKVTNEDNEGDVWKSIFSNPKCSVTDIVVYLTDGSQVMCNDLYPFFGVEYSTYRDAGVYPFYTDRRGNISLPVTHYRATPDQEWVKNEQINLQDRGSEWTFVPAGCIVRMDIRLNPK